MTWLKITYSIDARIQTSLSAFSFSFVDSFYKNTYTVRIQVSEIQKQKLTYFLQGIDLAIIFSLDFQHSWISSSACKQLKRVP